MNPCTIFSFPFFSPTDELKIVSKSWCLCGFVQTLCNLLRRMWECRFELKTLLMHYKDRVEFIQGTPVKDSDLDRVSAKVASAVYLLADSQAKVRKWCTVLQFCLPIAGIRHSSGSYLCTICRIPKRKMLLRLWEHWLCTVIAVPKYVLSWNCCNPKRLLVPFGTKLSRELRSFASTSLDSNS